MNYINEILSNPVDFWLILFLSFISVFLFVIESVFYKKNKNVDD